jgi:hypothetical protein
LRIHLVLEVSIPEAAGLFQALALAFWRFQSLAATTLFTAVVNAVQERARSDLEARHPGRFRHKGARPRTWELPFGSVRVNVIRLLDRLTGRVVCPLQAALDLPARVRFCEDTLLPGYRLAVLQSFRVSQRTLAAQHPGRAPSHHTLHRRFQGFADQLDPVPDLAHRQGSKPTAFQQADGTKLALQAHGHDAGHADLRLVVGSRTPHSRLEVLDFSLGQAWETIAERLRARFPMPPDVLVSDGEPGIAEALSGPQTVHQRCLVHARRNLQFALYQDRVKGAAQGPITEAFARIPALQACQAEVDRLARADRTTLQALLEASQDAFAAVSRRLPAETFPHTRQYVLGLVETGLAYLRQLLAGGPAPLVSTNRTESLMSRLALRLKRIGRRWSVPGALHMLAAVLTTALHPEDYAKAEALLRGEQGPTVGVVITSLDPTWVT